VAGIACESKFVSGRPIDLVYFNVGKLSTEEVAELQKEVELAGMPPKRSAAVAAEGNRQARRAAKATARQNKSSPR